MMLSMIRIVAAIALAAASIAAAAAQDAPKTERGEEIMNAACRTCNDLRPIETQALDEAGWIKEVTAMIEQGAEVKKEDVKITMEDGTLTISGDRKYEKAENGKKYHRVERAYGSFGRSFSLPDDASPAKVTADFKDGVLKVHLAKNEKPRPQQVEVSVS